jgi:hypothetical protein
MILLSDWANYRKSAPLVDDEDVGHDDGASVADVMEALIDNVQVASRFVQAMRIRQDVQAKLDDVTGRLVDVFNAGLTNARKDLDRQLKVLFLPLLTERLEAKAIEDFCTGLVVAIGKDTARHLVIAAPPELQQRLAARLAVTDLETSIVPTEGAEVSTTLETTEITTEIGKWKADLQRLLS